VATLDALTDVTFAVLLTTIGARIKEGQYGGSNQELVIEGFWAVLEAEDIPGRKFSPCCELQGGRAICNRGAWGLPRYLAAGYGSVPVAKSSFLCLYHRDINTMNLSCENLGVALERRVVLVRR